jgi:hypothetical protein
LEARASTYNKRFGSLSAAYKLIGFQPKPRYRWAETKARIHTIVGIAIARIVSSIEALGANATFDGETRLLTVNDKIRISVGSARCISYGRGSGPRWRVRPDCRPDSELTLVVKMNASNEKIQSYYLLPSNILPQTRCKKFCITNRVFSISCRYGRLDALVRALLSTHETLA